MKNIHILPTSKASRLFVDIDDDKLALTDNPIKGEYMMNRHLYITSDEEIKEGWKGYAFKEDLKGKVFKHFYTQNEWYKDAKKIILTTDQDLINNGIQAIDDEFLKWFVKNPSCEEVNLENHVLEFGYNLYKIIIPKEELKQSVEEYEQQGLEKYSCELEFNQETVEEAAKHYSLELLNSKTIQPHERTWVESIFIEGAKRQAERSCSKEEVLNLLTFVNDRLPDLYSRFSPEEELNEYLNQKHEEN